MADPASRALATARASGVSATEPDWSREIPRRWWDPSRRLLSTIRRYQMAQRRGGMLVRRDGQKVLLSIKGTAGDAVFAVLCACGHNIRKILAHLRALLAAVLAMIRQEQFQHHGLATASPRCSG